MGAEYTTKKNLIPKMLKKARQLDGKSVEVGVFGGDYAYLAGIHEYGCRIKVTPEMRAFLHYHGIHLKKETQEIVIPERSFIRSGFDMYHKDAIDYFDKVYGEYLVSRQHPETILKNTGKLLASKIKRYARALKSPPKSKATKILGAKSKNPLVETGAMIAHITYRIGGNE